MDLIFSILELRCDIPQLTFGTILLIITEAIRNERRVDLAIEKIEECRIVCHRNKSEKSSRSAFWKGDNVCLE